MALVVKCGQMDQDTKDIGKVIKLMDKESSSMLTVTYMKVSG